MRANGVLTVLTIGPVVTVLCGHRFQSFQLFDCLSQ